MMVFTGWWRDSTLWSRGWWEFKPQKKETTKEWLQEEATSQLVPNDAQFSSMNTFYLQNVLFIFLYFMLIKTEGVKGKKAVLIHACGFIYSFGSVSVFIDTDYCGFTLPQVALNFPTLPLSVQTRVNPAAPSFHERGSASSMNPLIKAPFCSSGYPSDHEINVCCMLVFACARSWFCIFLCLSVLYCVCVFMSTLVCLGVYIYVCVCFVWECVYSLLWCLYMKQTFLFVKAEKGLIFQSHKQHMRINAHSSMLTQILS